jgi:hypothetical protein
MSRKFGGLLAAGCLLLALGRVVGDEQVAPADAQKKAQEKKPPVPPGKKPLQKKDGVAAPTTTAVETQPPPAPGRTDVFELPRYRAPEMLGDQPPFPFQPFPPLPFQPVPVQPPPISTQPPNPAPQPPAPGLPPPTNVIPPQRPGMIVVPPPRQAVVLIPGPRTFKIADNESPRPQDRVYYSFNYFDNLDGAANRRLGGDLRNIQASADTFGLEKTFLDGRASLGLRLPLQAMRADSDFSQFNHSSTSLGDLSTIVKYAVYADPVLDNWLSVGLAVTTPTGPRTFAGFANVQQDNMTTFQPFVGGLWHFGDWYAQGFSAIDVPTDVRQPTLWYNDIGIGYFLFQRHDPNRFLTAVAPTFEVHVGTPLTHQGILRGNQQVGASDEVNLTAGANFEFFDRYRLAVGVVVPVVGPRPFDVEGVVQFRIRF